MPDQYVALGSSFAAGPGIATHVPGTPRAAWRSTGNHAHLPARRLDLDLVDVTDSGATTTEMVDGGRHGPSQVEAVTGDTRLVTITGGGNDVGYLPRGSLRRFGTGSPSTAGSAASAWLRWTPVSTGSSRRSASARPRLASTSSTT